MRTTIAVVAIIIAILALVPVLTASVVWADPPPSEVWVDDDWAGIPPGQPADGHTMGYDAFAVIQDGINAVASPGTVHVADGYYVENITLKDGVQLLGAGADVTTIDGGGAGSVVTATGIGPGTVLDGFTITNGSTDHGGGMNNFHSSPTVTNCIFSSNSANTWGGGMSNYPDSSPTVTNCIFDNNSSAVDGGGMYNWHSSPTVTNCTFSSNSATWGGGMRNLDCWPTVTNCTFSSNSATADGGGMYTSYSWPTVTNCTFSSNSAGWGAGMYNWHSSPTVTNCILWDNGAEMHNEDSTPAVTYCDIEGGYPGEGNISQDPMFVGPAGGDYHLQTGSPCIDAGTNEGAPTEDIEGNPRPIDGDGDSTATTDMGAYEYVGAVPPTPTPTPTPPPPCDYADDFGTETGLWTYWGSAYRDEVNGYVVLTEAISNQSGIIWLNYEFTSPFSAEFRYKVGGGTGSDGFVFMFYKTKDYQPADGGQLAFNESPVGLAPGYGIELDSWQNSAGDPGFEQADPSADHIALIKDKTGNHLSYVNDTRTADNQWHRVRVTVDSDSVDVELDGDHLLSWEGEIDRTFGSVGFGAATGGGHNWHIIDDVCISTLPPPPVGGTIVPTDKLGLVMPWVMAAALIVAAGVSLAIWNRKRGADRASGR